MRTHQSSRPVSTGSGRRYRGVPDLSQSLRRVEIEPIPVDAAAGLHECPVCHAGVRAVNSLGHARSADGTISKMMAAHYPGGHTSSPGKRGLHSKCIGSHVEVGAW